MTTTPQPPAAIPLPLPAPYEDPSGRARQVTSWLWASFGATLLALVATVVDLYVLRDRAYTKDEANLSDALSGLAALIEFGAFVVAAIMFIRWIRRITANVRATTQGEPRFGTGWATWGWFVPVLNLWRPYQVVAQAWRSTEPAGQGVLRPARGDSADVSGLLGVWWAAWLISNFAARGLARAKVDTVDQIMSVDRLYLGAYAIDVALALLAINLVRTLTARQRARAAELGIVRGEPGVQAGAINPGDAASSSTHSPFS